MHPELVKAALACARSAFGDVGLIAVTPLRGNENTSAWRLVLITDAGPRTAIASAGVRDRAAHEILTPHQAPDFPRVLATSDDPPLTLLEDMLPA